MSFLSRNSAMEKNITLACKAWKRKGSHSRNGKHQYEGASKVKKVEGDMKSDEEGLDEEGTLYTL